MTDTVAAMEDMAAAAVVVVVEEETMTDGDTGEKVASVANLNCLQVVRYLKLSLGGFYYLLGIAYEPLCYSFCLSLIYAIITRFPPY